VSDSHRVVGPAEPIVWGHFEEIEQQEEANTLGMWLFLAQEIMFFGGLFAAYAVYRFKYPMAWHLGSGELDIFFGATNTSVLLASSVTMAMCVWATQRSRIKEQIFYLCATLFLGCVFLFIKWYFEWPVKYEHGLIPGPWWNPDAAHFPGVDIGNLQLFYVMYFIMTSMHALHMVIGIGIGLWLLVMSLRGTYGENRFLPIEFFRILLALCGRGLGILVSLVLPGVRASMSGNDCLVRRH